ncbi:hypothetical protein [Pedobacter hiemivivus]|uniref:Uncharacterized protein n=1 Tax=Pedobacter hiemivivus TaxID=2530454 RepID=A0A4R0N8S0_9SPHI|nr:hypothetical protein [Pedobacter hiemivivus]TCC96569.1 hypothetical protein EZ444_11380 [Pedobacter hiemivivus]
MRKNINAVLLIFAAILTLITSCKKVGELMAVPSFGNLSVKFNTPADHKLLLRIDGQLKDTLKDDGNLFQLEVGDNKISVTDFQGKMVLDTTIKIERSKTASLEGVFTGAVVLLDNMDLTIKPQTDSLLIRFITTDPLLPDQMDIEISLCDFGGTTAPLGNKKISGIRKDKFSAYIQLPNPNVIDPSFDSTFMFYVIEGYDATPGGTRRKVMSIDELSVSFLDYRGAFDFVWVPNNIISFGIGPAPEDGSTTLRNPKLIFQRTNP